jgi:hypothetical protein
MGAYMRGVRYCDGQGLCVVRFGNACIKEVNP